MNRRPGRFPIVVMTLLATLAVGVGAGAVAYSTLSSDTKTVIQQVPVETSEPTASNSTLTAAQIYTNTHKSVVEITVGSVQVDPFGGEQQQRGQGSGFVIDSDGHIVTNDHVVEDADTVSVRFWNGDTYDANVVGTDASTDLAVIKVDAPDSVLHPLTVGDSSERSGRQHSLRARQPPRARRQLHERHRERAPPADRGAERLLDQRLDPDRRGDQPRKLRRSAPQLERRGDRSQRADRGSTPAPTSESASRSRRTP